VEDQLEELGVSVNELRASPRRLDAETIAGSSWSPLGAAPRLAPRELLLVGPYDDTWRDSDPTTVDRFGPRSLFVELFDESTGTVSPETTFVRYEDQSDAPSMGPVPDRSGVRPGSQATRDVAAADFDRDGLEEGAIVRGHQLGTNWVIDGTFVDDDETYAGPRALFEKVVGARAIDDLAVAAGELTGDGNPDVVVAMLKSNHLALIPFPGLGDGRFDHRASAGAGVVLLEETPGTRSVEIAQGNLDWDPELETLVVLRTWDDSLEGGHPTGEARWLLYDDLADDPLRPQLLDQGEVRLPSLADEGATGELTRPVTASAAIGDFDGDGLDEIAFAGLTRVSLTCRNDHYGVRVLDDRPHAGVELARGTFATPAPPCESGSGSGAAVFEVITNAVQWEGDHPAELQVNERVFDLQGAELVEVASLDLLPTTENQHFSRASHDIVTADVTNDGLDEVMSYSAYDGVLRIRGHRRDHEGAVVPFRHELHYEPGELNAPVLAPFDNDLDGHSLRFLPGSHRVELTAPIVHAVLAAPPCDPARGQDLGNCYTRYGEATSSGVETQTTTTATASATVGITAGLSYGPFAFEATVAATVEAWMSSTTGSAYELTYAVDYLTFGRDAVVFTSIPYDVYEYEIVGSHRPGEIGQRLAFFFPRRPVTRPVSVGYFNARVPPGGLRIDEEVLAHRAGDLSSYRSRDDVRAIANRVRGRSPRDPLAFLEQGPRDVGGAQTRVDVTIDVAETSFVEESMGLRRSISVSLTGGLVMTEVSVGREDSVALRTHMTSETSFSGGVPGLADGHPSYAFGMFTYMARKRSDDGTRQWFQVIDYWVE
jgi:hypothetical protein